MASCASPAATLPPWLTKPSGQPAANRSRQWWPAQPSPDTAADGNTPGLVPEDEESLEELTALCTGASPRRSVGSDHVTNKATVLQQGDPARSDTQDSACTANLLPMLQVDNPQQLEPPLQMQQVLADPNISKAASKADAVMLTSAEDIGEDIPLVSSRKNSILDIVSGRTRSNVVGSVPTSGNPPRYKLPFLQTTISSASTGTNSVGITATASDSPTGSCEPWGGGLAAAFSDASVPSVLSFVSASGASTSFAPLSAPGLAAYSAEAAQACRLLYVGVFLTPASRDVLLSMVPAVHQLVRGDHMTLVFKPSLPQLLNYPLGVDVELRVLGSAADGRVQAVFVEAPSWLETSSACAHITISVSPGAQAVEAGRLIRDALQQAAEESTSDPICQAGPGAYQHLEEPLPLIGRLGLMVALPAATAASLDWADSSSGAWAPSSTEVEVVAYSIEELATPGCISIDQDTIKAYKRRHGHLFGNTVSPDASPSPTALTPSAVRELPTSIMDLFPQVCSPAAATATATEVVTPAATPTGAISTATNISSPVLQCPAGGGAFAGGAAASSSSSALLAATAAAAAYSPGGTVSPCNLSVVSKTPGDTAADAVESPPDSPKSSSSSGSSTSSVDAVQFLSAVHEGDYVALRPFVPADGSERLLQGYVREFACYEPFQADGVLAVLTDNTIAYVAMVLDSSSSNEAGSSSTAAAPACVPAATAAAPAASHKKRSSKASSKTLSVAYPVDPTSAPGSSKPQAPAGVVLGGSSSGIAGPLREWMLTAGSMEAAVSPVSPDLKRRNAADAERDMQLWRDFEALQRKHGESLCNSILESCNHDFGEAMELIKGQGSTLQAAAAAAAAGESPVPSPRAPASVHKSRGAAGAGAAATAADEGLVQQLALSLGLLPTDAVKLARLVPHLPAEVVVQELQKQLGDVGAAADALLSGAAAGDSGRASPTGSTASSSAVLSPEARAAKSLLSCQDPVRMVAAQQLREMCPGLSMDLALLLLEEHGGDVSEAAQALSDMQATELEARTSAAAGCSSPTMMSLVGSSRAQHPTDAGASSSRGMAVGMEGLSEADQLAILAAMGEFTETEPTCNQQQQSQHAALKHQLVGSPVQPSPVSRSPRRRAAPHMALPGPAYYATQDADEYPHPYQQGHRHAAPPPPPPPPRAAVVEGFVEMENKRKAKEAADALYKKAKTHNAAADVLTTAAQDDAKNGDMVGCRQKLDEANKLRQQAKAAVDDAQRLSWSANNNRSSVWEVDLHGLGVTKAIAKFAQQFKALQLLEHPGGVLFRVIVGQGKHSEDKVPKIKLGILQYLEEQSKAALQSTGEPWNITWEVDPCNPGVINVHLPAETEESDA